MYDKLVCSCQSCNTQPTIDDDMLNMLFTVISGVLVFVVGQLFNEYFLKPIQQYKQLRAKISYSLTYYANLYMNPVSNDNYNSDDWKIGSQKMRELSAEVRAIIEIRPIGNIFIPKKKKLAKVAENIMGISNGFFATQKIDYCKNNNSLRIEIYELLRIKYN